VSVCAANRYNFTAYQVLAGWARDAGLRMQAVMSFHQCGGNVGDACNIPLPGWVLRVAQQTPDLFYRDREGLYDPEYLSLGVDDQPLLPSGDGSGRNRTAVEAYADFMNAFALAMQNFMPSTVNQVQVGLGPAGELRYPSYISSRWQYCGIGEFQCYDAFMLQKLQEAAAAAGHAEWGHGGPNNAGQYRSSPPSSAPFFSMSGFDNYASDYGRFFLTWYSQALIEHGKVGQLERWE
jgi:beta-amylase